MQRVKVCVELDDAEYRAYAAEARRRGVDVEALIQQMVQGLVRELRQEEADGTDHPIFPA